jgi:hypothetical protein
MELITKLSRLLKAITHTIRVMVSDFLISSPEQCGYAFFSINGLILA